MHRSVIFEIRLVPEGRGHHARAISLAPLTKMRLRLVLPWYLDREKTRANLMDTVAHEAFHVYWFLKDQSIPQDEVTAYWIGMCAQLRAGRILTEDDLPGGEMVGVGEIAGKSSKASAQARRDAYQLLQQGELSESSPLGVHLLDECGKAWESGPPAAQWWSAPESTDRSD